MSARFAAGDSDSPAFLLSRGPQPTANIATAKNPKYRVRMMNLPFFAGTIVAALCGRPPETRLPRPGSARCTAQKTSVRIVAPRDHVVHEVVVDVHRHEER